MKKKVIFGLLGAVVVELVAESADATNVGAYAGGRCSGGYCDGYGCLTEDYGTVNYSTNLGVCSGGSSSTAYWEVQLPVNAGTYNPTINVAWPSGSQMGNYIECTTTSQSQFNYGSAYQNTGFGSATSTAGHLAYQPGSVTVPSNGFMYVECAIVYQGRMLNVQY
jgi:hypothetical protein